MKQTQFVVADPLKCSGCRACEIACFANHHRYAHPGEVGKTVGTVSTPVLPDLFLARTGTNCMPVQCHHCEDAPCVKSCLTEAIVKVDGVVLVNAKKCIGCRNCAMACPFGAIEVFSAEEVKTGPYVYKCDLCASISDPACAAACPNEALRLVDVETEIAAKRIQALESAPDMTLAETAAM
jgi:electron transport protein HydN